MPAATNATSPLEELTVQTPVVELVKVLAPVPADAVAVRVGGVATIVYVDVYEPASIAKVRVARDITIENELVVATAVLASVIRAVIVEVPLAVGVPEITPVEVFRVTPAGNDPDATEKVPEPDPPLVASVRE